MENFQELIAAGWKESWQVSETLAILVKGEERILFCKELDAVHVKYKV